MNTKDFRIEVSLVVLVMLLACFATFVWPTPYWYVSSAATPLIRINRMTLHAEYLVNGEWTFYNESPIAYPIAVPSVDGLTPVPMAPSGRTIGAEHCWR